MRFVKLIKHVIDYVNSRPLLEATVAGMIFISALGVWIAIAFYLMP